MQVDLEVTVIRRRQVRVPNIKQIKKKSHLILWKQTNKLSPLLALLRFVHTFTYQSM